MIADPEDLIGESLPAGKPRPASTRRGCRRGCVLSGFVVLLLLLVGVAGLGLPYTYWHRLGYAQVFEGPDRVVLFVEVERAMNRPGLFPGAYPYNFAAALLRIDVFPDGRVERTTFKSNLGDELTFNTNLYAVVRLADGFYLAKMFGDAQMPTYRLGPDRIEALSSSEALVAKGQDILQASNDPFDLSGVDAVSLRNGWRRLNHEPGHGPYLLIGPDPLESTRHGLRFRHVPRWLGESEPESIVAESLSPTDRWTRTLIEVDTRHWRAYKSPGDRAYLRAKYTASPAR